MKTFFCLLVAMVAMMGNTANAEIHLNHRFGLGLGGGVALPVNYSTFRDAAGTGWTVNGHGDYYFSDAFALQLEYQHIEYKTSNPISNFFTLGVNYRWVPAATVTPVLGLAGGWGTSTGLGPFDASYNNFLAKAKFGFDFAIGPNAILEADAKYTWLFSKVDGRFDQGTITPELNITYFFGKSIDSDHPQRPDVVAAPVAAPVDGDDDGDGVPNSIDKCPNTPAGTKVNSLGCPLAEKVNYTIDIEFNTGKATFGTTYNTELDKMVDLLKQHDDLSTEIQGYSDNVGKKASNKALSARRAKAVAQYLTSHGIDASRVTSQGYGEENPVADNSTAEGRKQNRRVVASLRTKSST